MRWVENSLNDLGSVSRGRSRHRPRDAEHLYGGPYPFVQTGDIKHAGLYLTKYQQTYSEAGLAQSKLWSAGTLCITIAANIAETSILGIDACFPDSVIGFVADEHKTDARFVKYMFDARLKKRYQTFSQGVAQDNLSQEKLLSIKFPMPSDVGEQAKIADVLSTYDEQIANNMRRIELLEQSARLLFKEWFVHLRYPGHEHDKTVDGVPEGWHRSKISQLGVVITGKTPSKSVLENFGWDTPFIKTPDMRQAIIVIDTEESLSERGAATQNGKTLPKFSTLVSCIGTVGIVALNGLAAQTNQQINSIVPTRPEVRFFNYFVARDLKSRLEAIGGGVTMANVSKSKFEALPVLLPTEGLLHDFDAFCEPVFENILLLERANGILSKGRDLLLPRLMDGRLSV